MNYEKMWNTLRLKFGNRFVPIHTKDTSEAGKIGNISLSEILDLFENGEIAEYRVVSKNSQQTKEIDELNTILSDKSFVSEESATNYLKTMWKIQNPEIPYNTIADIVIEKICDVTQ